MEKKVVIVLSLLLFTNSLPLAISSDDNNSNNEIEIPELSSAINIDDDCQADYYCHINNTECRMKTCKCKPNYIFRDGICLDPIGLICYESYDCESLELACLLGTCQLIKTFFSPENKKNSDLYSPKFIGDYCTNNEQCSELNNTICIEGACECSKNFFEVDNKCIERNGNLTCSTHYDCDPYKIRCYLGTCQTLNTFIPPENLKDNDSFYFGLEGDYCTDDDGCTRYYDNTRCVGQECECLKNFVSVGYKCVESNSNSTCSGRYDCGGSDLGCFFGTCQSLEEFFSPENKHQNALYYAENIDDYCLNDDHCRYVPHSICSLENKCVCPKDWVTAPPSKCLGKVNAPCRSDYDCAYEEMGCVLETCQLLSEFFSPSNAQNISLYFDLKSKHVDYCRYNYDCHHLEFAECSNFRCKCRHNYIIKDRKCRGLINAQCYINSDCALDNTECRNGTCQLKS
ncbi:prion-like-(Q/N-rich) domain-bearing protein 25 [Microplitis mediator]|uniref:prion-like-(Q/N-rich) domain-bearing protein 25 n=1 Tax=Microplitis mediator TaxID=375433 RepID=UPI0025577916|nr:prion-like-(Q/N-rich) domain-bearing protein 25 [Microplitis mediator]